MATPAVVGSNWKAVYLHKEIKSLFKLNAMNTAPKEYIISIYEECTEPFPSCGDIKSQLLFLSEVKLA